MPAARSRPAQRIGGLVIAAIGIGFTAWLWTSHGPTVSLRGATIFPAFAVIGLALIAFPSYRDERIARGEDISALTGMRLITPRWWVVLIVALAAGFLDAYLITR